MIGVEGDAETHVDGQGNGSVATVGEGAAVQLSGLTLTNGRTNGSGGGLFIGRFADPAMVTLTSSTVSGNVAGTGCGFSLEGGGGVYNGNGLLTIHDSRIVDNRAGDELFCYAGGGGVLQLRGHRDDHEHGDLWQPSGRLLLALSTWTCGEGGSPTAAP